MRWIMESRVGSESSEDLRRWRTVNTWLGQGLADSKRCAGRTGEDDQGGLCLRLSFQKYLYPIICQALFWAQGMSQ